MLRAVRSLVTVPVRNHGWISRVERGSAPESPVVLLLGWAMSKREQLDKFSAYHNRLGRDTVSYSLPMPHLLTFDQELQREAAVELVRKIRSVGAGRKTSPKPTDVIIHAFSNNGMCMYQHVVELLEEENKAATRKSGSPEADLRVTGAIFDSCPGPWTFLSNFLVPMFGRLGVTQKPNKYFPLAACFTLYHGFSGKGFVDSVLETLRAVPAWRQNMKKYWGTHKCPGNFLLEERRTFPILFLYSEGDKLIPSRFVEALAEIHEKRGRRVFKEDFGSFCWHVAHYKNYPEHYEETVENFIKEVKKSSS